MWQAKQMDANGNDEPRPQRPKAGRWLVSGQPIPEGTDLDCPMCGGTGRVCRRCSAQAEECQCPMMPDDLDCACVRQKNRPRPL